MKRADFLTKLETVAPALAANDIVPIMTHFWFTGKSLRAYNGHTAISVPFETDFKCAVPGILLAMVKAAGAKQVELAHEGGEFRIKGATTKIKLPTMDAGAFNFNMPKPPADPLETSAEKFMAAIGTCLRSISLDTSVPDYLGVTIIPDGKRAQMYGSSGITLSRANVTFKSEVPFAGRAILPSLFCKQLLHLAKGDKRLRFSISVEENRERVMYANDNVTMWGQLVQSEKPLNFAKVFEKYHSEAEGPRMVPIASKLQHILERATVVAAGEATTVRTRVTVKDGVATFFTASKSGEVRDQMQLPEGHPDVTIDVEPKWVRAGCADFDRMLITEQCFVMANDTAYYLIAGRDD